MHSITHAYIYCMNTYARTHACTYKRIYSFIMRACVCVCVNEMKTWHLHVCTHLHELLQRIVAVAVLDHVVVFV